MARRRDARTLPACHEQKTWRAALRSYPLPPARVPHNISSSVSRGLMLMRKNEKRCSRAGAPRHLSIFSRVKRAKRRFRSAVSDLHGPGSSAGGNPPILPACLRTARLPVFYGLPKVTHRPRRFSSLPGATSHESSGLAPATRGRRPCRAREFSAQVSTRPNTPPAGIFCLTGIQQGRRICRCYPVRNTRA